MNTSSKRQAAQGRHTVVLGGSLAGLLAARVLSDHFDEVTLIERDVLATTAEVRRPCFEGKELHENADRNHGRERQMGGRQKVSEHRLVS
jgi:pyruvate/2-oxoglutarate dehydrogenase complex dihydrolipoamide dehydrogenase (E3) component